jgi:hypothetical protein
MPILYARLNGLSITPSADGGGKFGAATGAAAGGGPGAALAASLIRLECFSGDLRAREKRH